MRTAISAAPDRWTSPTLRIYRGPKSRTDAVIPPPEPAVSLWKIGGRPFRQLFFTDAQWVRFPEKDRPKHAHRIDGIGLWTMIIPDEKGLHP